MQSHIDRHEAGAYRGRILVIEDDPATRQGLKIRLNASGYDVVAARSAREGLHKARHERPDAILMDLGLPDVDGLDLLTELRKNPACRLCPIIVLTSRDPRNAKLKCLSAGAQSYLLKPVENERLLQEIVRLMAQGDLAPQSTRAGGLYHRVQNATGTM